MRWIQNGWISGKGSGEQRRFEEEGAKIEALRAIAEEFEKHNAILDRGRVETAALLEEIRDALECASSKPDELGPDPDYDLENPNDCEKRAQETDEPEVNEDQLKPRTDPKVDELLGLLGPMGPDVRGLFALMEIAEEELRAAKERHPLAEFAIHKSFHLLEPTASLFQDKHSGIYRAHCGELLDRVAAGASRKALRLGTHAEVLCVMTGWSLEHAPGPQGAALLSMLFAEVFPEKADPDDSNLFREPFPGATEELLGALQRKIEKGTNRGNG